MIHDSICGLIDNKVCARRACVIGLHFTVLVSLVYTLQCLPTCVIGLHFTVLANLCH